MERPRGSAGCAGNRRRHCHNIVIPHVGLEKLKQLVLPFCGRGNQGPEELSDSVTATQHNKRAEELGFEPSSTELQIPGPRCSFCIPDRWRGLGYGTEMGCPGGQHWPSPWLRSALPLHGGRSRPSLWQSKAACTAASLSICEKRVPAWT